MRADVCRDMRRSKSSFESLVWPAIGPLIGGGQAISMELSTDSELRTLFDVTSGIDAWQVSTAGGMYAIASRVQPYGKDWSTFTVRLTRASGAKTEWEKLRDACYSRDGRVFPQWFVQAYTSKDGSSLLSCAAVRTAELVSHIDFFCSESQDVRENRCDGNKFWMVGWDRPARHGSFCLTDCGSTSLVVVRPDKEEAMDGR